MKEAINKGKSSNKGPCGACKFLRRKCVKGCVFAPYFSAENDEFAPVHKVFGASNASKLLLRLPPHARAHAVLTLSYQARARINDPVYGCVAHIFSLQQQVVNLQAKVAFVHAQLSTMQRNPTTPFPRSPIAQYSSANPTSDMAIMPSSDVSMHLTSSTPMSVFSPLVQELHSLDLEALGDQPLKSLYSAPTSN